MEMRASAEDAGRGSGVKGGGERVATKIFVGACGFFFMLGKPQYAGIIFMFTGFLIQLMRMNNTLDDINYTLRNIENNHRYSSWYAHRQ